MSKNIYTGTWLVYDQDEKHMLGSTSAYGQHSEPGTVRLSLKARNIDWDPDNIALNEKNIQWQANGGELIIEFPEQSVRKIADNLIKVATQLEHLRELIRHEKLAIDILTSDH